MFLLRELALLTLIASAEAGFYSGKSSPVVEVNSKNFKKEILESQHAAVVEFYAPWCGHCKNLKPAYEKVGASMKGLAKVAAIDCDEEANKRICGEYEVKGFPTLKLFKPSAKKGKPNVEDYNGARTAKAIADALAERIPNHVTRVTAPKLKEFLASKNETAKAILFTNKGTTGALWKSLAIDFLGSVTFAQIRDKETAAVEAFGVSEFPKVLLLPGGEQEALVYDGKLAKEPLLEFFKSVKAPVGEPKASETAEEEEEEKKEVPTETPKPMIPGLETLKDLQDVCFVKKAKTCLVALVNLPDPEKDATIEELKAQFDAVQKVNDKLKQRPPPHAFQPFITDGAGPLGMQLTKELGLKAERPVLVALNRKGWYRKYDGAVEDVQDVFVWLDAILLGEGKKEKLPASVLGDEEEAAAPVEAAEPEPEAEVKAEEAPEPEATASVKDEL